MALKQNPIDGHLFTGPDAQSISDLNLVKWHVRFDS